MNCPNCKTNLHISERQGVEIDFCPTCRGVWLDRGELDKIIQRNTNESRVAPWADEQRGEAPRYDSAGHEDDHRYDRNKKKKRESFLGELFDF